MKKLLTICIPTYNRSTYLKNQLSFFKNQIESNKGITKFISFIVSDNASNDSTADVLRKFQSDYKFFDYSTNLKNLGLVGNIIHLLKFVKTQYVWFVSDDDTLKKGVLEEVLNIIRTYQNPEFIFLNFTFNGIKGFNGKTGYRLDSKEAALEVYKERYGSLVFITSCIYKKDNLLDLLDNYMHNWLAAPLLYSFYSCSKGPSYYCQDAWVNFRPNSASYSGLKKELKLKFEEYIPILESLPLYGYNNESVKKIISVFISSQSHSHFLYNFVNFKQSICLYKYYSVKSIIRLPLNILDYLRKRLS